MPTLGRPSTATKPERKTAAASSSLLVPVAMARSRATALRSAERQAQQLAQHAVQREPPRRPAGDHVGVAELGQRLQAGAAGRGVAPVGGRPRRRRASSRSPAVTAAPRAARSAHRPAGYDAFSTLTPMNASRPIGRAARRRRRSRSTARRRWRGGTACRQSRRSLRAARSAVPIRPHAARRLRRCPARSLLRGYPVACHRPTA